MKELDESQLTSQIDNSKSLQSSDKSSYIFIKNANIKDSASDFNYQVQNNQVTITGYKGSGGNVVIPDIIENYPVTKIASSAFNSRSNINSITLPNTVLNVKEYAFNRCINLNEIILSSNIEIISYSFINKCPNVTSIIIPKSVKQITYSKSSYPFSDSSIEKVIFEEGTTKILDYFLYKAEKLKDVIIPDSVLEIGQYAFFSTGLVSLILPNQITSISDGLFENCLQLESISFSPNVTHIGNRAFCNCINLEKINHLTDKITYIGNLALFNCLKITDFVLPSKINYIGYQFISKCDKITTITIPKTLKRIYNKSSFSYPFVDSFISKIIFEEGCYFVDSYLLYNDTKLKEVILPKSMLYIEDYAFAYCISLKQITLPDNVKNIYQYAFASTGLTSIIIPNKVTSINDNLFGGCKQLASVEIPINTTIIGCKSFFNCINLEKIDLPEKIRTIEMYAFANCRKLKELVLPNNVVSLYNEIIYGCINIKSINIPESVYRVEYNLRAAFEGSFLSKVTFEEGRVEIRDKTLYRISTLNEVILPKSLQIIGMYAFSECPSLKHIDIPENVTSIDIYAFAKSGFISIKLPKRLTIVKNHLFDSCQQLISVTFPDELSTIKYNSFYNCSSLTQIKCPEKLEKIDDFAFQFCISLTKFFVNENLKYIESRVFSFTPSLILYVFPNSYAENFAKSNSIKYRYYFSYLTLNAKIISSSDISDMKLTLKDKDVNYEKTISLISNTNSYSFYGLECDHEYDLFLMNKYGICITKREKLFFNNNITTYEIVVNNTYSVNVTVFDDMLNDVTSQTSIIWYDENKNYISKSNSLSQIIYGTNLQYEIELNDLLLKKYHKIQMKSINIIDTNDIKIQLIPFQKIQISGKILNDNNDPISNSTIFVTQLLESNYYNNIYSYSDINGEFSMQIYDFPFKLIVSHNDYLTKTVEIVDTYQNIDIGSIILSKMTGKKIPVTINCLKVLTNDNEPKIRKYDITSYGLNLNLINPITKEEIHDFIFNDQKLILMKSIDLLEKIQINVSTDSDEFNPITILHNLDQPNISVTLIQKGRLIISYLRSQNPKNWLMIYNEKGKLVRELDFTLNNITTPFLDDGYYYIIVMGKNDIFSNIYSLSDLQSFNIVNETDYVSQCVKITSCEIKRIQFINVPQFNYSKFNYIDNEKTSFIAKNQDMFNIPYYSIKGQVSFKKQYLSEISNMKLIIEIPESCEYIQNTFFIDPKTTLFSIIDKKIIIPFNNKIDSFCICLMPKKQTVHIINAYVEFMHFNKKVLLQMGSAEIKIKEPDFYIPEKTGNKTIIAYGNSYKSNNIDLYCNDILVGQTQTDNEGNWIIKFELNTSITSTHLIYAKVNSLINGLSIISKTKKLKYSPKYIDIKQIKFYCNRKEYIINYPQLFQKFQYYSSNSAEDITFLVIFTDNNPDYIKSVNLIIVTLDNKVIYIPAIFDKNKKLWIAKRKLYSIKIISIDYNCEEPITVPKKILNQPLNMSISTTKKQDDLFKIFDFNPIHVKNTFSEKSEYGTFIENYEYTDEDNESNMILIEIEVSPFIYNNSEIIDKFNKNNNTDNIIKITDDENSSKLYYIEAISGEEEIFINPEKKSIFKFNFEWPDFNIPDVIEFDDVKKWLAKAIKKCKWLTKLIKKSAKYLDKIDLFGVLDFFSYLDDLLDSFDTAEEYLNKLTDPKALCIPDEQIKHLYYTLGVYISLHFSKFLILLLKISRGADLCEFAIDTGIEKSLIEYDKVFEEYKCKTDYEDYLADKLKNKFILEPIIDPSGFVYEAVESNRIKNVTTTIFQNIIKTDMYGQQYNVSEFWNAKLYGQQNPLLTNDLGWYAWDVPEGLWQVKYEKSNYETTYSNWLPVPPPQLNVDISIISLVQPEIKRINGYENRIEIEFSKYMKCFSLNRSNIIITKNNINISGILMFKNEESDSKNNNTHLASLIYFIPSEKLQINDEIQILIKNNVMSYSGVLLNADYNNLINIYAEPTIKSDGEISNIIYGEIEQFSFYVIVNPIEFIKGKKLLLQSDSPNIVKLHSESIEISNDENITISVDILLPGTAQIEIMIEGTGIKISKVININLPKSKLKTVVSSIKADSCVRKNTFVELYSRNEGSTIYYSINQSINNKNYYKYNGSIVINNKMKLNAIVRHENYDESDPVSYDFDICPFCNIIFNANGGKLINASKEILLNEKFGELPIPEREFYMFAGWFTELTFDTMVTNETIAELLQNYVLYAKWNPNIYEITFETNNGSYVDSIIQPHGTELKEPENPIKSGFEFSGWFDDVELNHEFIFNIMPTKNITLYAKWLENENIHKSKNKNTILYGIIGGCSAFVVITITVSIVIVVKKRKLKIGNSTEFDSNPAKDENDNDISDIDPESTEP